MSHQTKINAYFNEISGNIDNNLSLTDCNGKSNCIISTHNKNKYGQYMTPMCITDFMVNLISHGKDCLILEPSSGGGAFIDTLHKHKYYNICSYEIDSSLINKNHDCVINSSYVSTPNDENYDVIIGNPPYIRWKNLEENLKDELLSDTLWNTYCNSLCDYSAIFIVKAIKQLKDGGELIFITPEYWMTTTHSQKMRDLMLAEGYFEEIYCFNETPIFKGVKSSLIIFKYIKSFSKIRPDINITTYYSNKMINSSILTSLLHKDTSINAKYYLIPQFIIGNRWVIAESSVLENISKYEKRCIRKDNTYYTIGDVCDIGNGMVSGLDKAFQVKNIDKLNDFEMNSMIKVLKANSLKMYKHDEYINYIFVSDINDEEQFIDKCPHFYNMLKPYVTMLKNRYSYNKDLNYWNWAFLRNYKLFSRNEDKIFVPCKERITKKNNFRFSFCEKDIFPTQDVTAIYRKQGVNESIYYILALLNSNEVFIWLANKGVRKGDIVEFCEKPISSIPYLSINFDNSFEKDIHDKISDLVYRHITEKSDNINEIQKLFTMLIDGK